jgi:hypothetical protein
LEATLLPRFSPNPTITITPEATLSIQEVEKKIELYAQTNGNCDFPCFWGLEPEKTSQQQMESLLTVYPKNNS